MVALLTIALMAVGSPTETASAELIHAITLVQTRDLNTALGELEKLCPLPRNKISKAAQRGDVACRVRVFALYESEKSGDPKDNSLVYWNAGDDAYRKGQLGISEALLGVAVDRDPNDPDGQDPAALGRCFRRF